MPYSILLVGGKLLWKLVFGNWCSILCDIISKTLYTKWYVHHCTYVCSVIIVYTLGYFQVMSNDRVIVCNFETAIQTDPNTCLMVVSGGVAPPSNRTGLSPEVLGAFAKLRYAVDVLIYVGVPCYYCS